MNNEAMPRDRPTERQQLIGLCCSEASEYQNCLDAITCTESDELYQLYLVSVGTNDGFTFTCLNDTLSGFIDFVFLT